MQLPQAQVWQSLLGKLAHPLPTSCVTTPRLRRSGSLALQAQLPARKTSNARRAPARPSRRTPTPSSCKGLTPDRRVGQRRGTRHNPRSPTSTSWGSAPQRGRGLGILRGRSLARLSICSRVRRRIISSVGTPTMKLMARCRRCCVAAERITTSS